VIAFHFQFWKLLDGVELPVTIPVLWYGTLASGSRPYPEEQMQQIGRLGESGSQEKRKHGTRLHRLQVFRQAVLWLSS
jgi:hypothetical protein